MILLKNKNLLVFEECKISKRIYFWNKNKRGKIRKFSKHYLPNPTRYDPFRKYNLKAKFDEDLFSNSVLEEKDDENSYESFTEQDGIVFKHGKQSTLASGLI